MINIVRTEIGLRWMLRSQGCGEESVLQIRFDIYPSCKMAGAQRSGMGLSNRPSSEQMAYLKAENGKPEFGVFWY